VESRFFGSPAVVLFSLALSAACDRSRPDPVVLALGDQVVRRTDFERQLLSREREGRLDSAVRRALFDAFIEERVLVLEARRRGLLPPEAGAPEEASGVQRLLAGAASAAPVLEPEIASYFEAHQAELGSREHVTLHQILVPTENQARDVLRRLQKDPKSFEVLARSMSRGPEASTGGLMGTFGRAELPPELEAAAFGLAVGVHSEPIQSALGYHVLRVDAREAARARSLEECRAEIRALLQRENSDRAVRGFVQELLARAKVNHEAVEVADRSS
jgi:parvulin-like peptidyl-prolyl isomerase